MEVAHLIRIKICISDSMPRTAFPISHRGAMGSQPREFVIRFLLALRESTAMEGSEALSLSPSLFLCCVPQTPHNYNFQNFLQLSRSAVYHVARWKKEEARSNLRSISTWKAIDLPGGFDLKFRPKLLQ